MGARANPKVLADFLKNKIEIVLREFDLKVAETKEKHFVIIHCVYSEGIGTAYKFHFESVNSPSVDKLDILQKVAILNTELNNDVCFVIVDENYMVTTINYKRELTNTF
ncbi:MAG: hypothetical protein ACXVNM_06330 [Bacteroidia bacterium]